MKDIRSILCAVLLLSLAVLSFSACGGRDKTSVTAPAGASSGERSDEDASSGSASSGAAVDATALIAEKAEKYKDVQDPIAVLVMESGECIVIELYKNVAPQTVKNFITLTDQGFYDGLTFHRIDPNFMIQGGDPEGTGYGGPGYEIFGEFSSNGFKNDLSHTRGVVSMARRSNGPNTGGSQFFIVVRDSTYLDGDYAAFGEVLEGMDVVDGIASAPTGGSRGETPLTPRVMQTVRIAEQGSIHGE